MSETPPDNEKANQKKSQKHDGDVSPERILQFGGDPERFGNIAKGGDAIVNNTYYGPSSEEIHQVVQHQIGTNVGVIASGTTVSFFGTDESKGLLEKTKRQIEYLRARLIKLISVREAVLNLSWLQQPTTSLNSLHSIKKKSKTEIARHSIKIGTPFWSHSVEMPEYAEESSEEYAESYLKQLIEIEEALGQDIGYKDLFEMQSQLRLVTDKINVDVYRVYSIFLSYLYPAVSSKDLIDNLVSKLGDKELKEEAKIHALAVRGFIERLDENELLKKGVEDVLSEEAKIAIGVMAEITHRRIIVEELIQEDRRKRLRTKWFVSGYIIFVFVLLGVFYYFHGVRLQIGERPLGEMRLPFFGIPWPVVLWSLIGSIAAIIYQFNKKPISDFGDATKWMLTRPIQGVILGSTFYLVLISGLFLLTGTDPSDTSGAVRVDEIILVLVFLVGFSDRFADAVFNTLVERFSNDAKERPNNDANSNHNESQ